MSVHTRQREKGREICVLGVCGLQCDKDKEGQGSREVIHEDDGDGRRLLTRESDDLTWMRRCGVERQFRIPPLSVAFDSPASQFSPSPPLQLSRGKGFKPLPLSLPWSFIVRPACLVYTYVTGPFRRESSAPPSKHITRGKTITHTHCPSVCLSGCTPLLLSSLSLLIRPVASMAAGSPPPPH